MKYDETMHLNKIDTYNGHSDESRYLSDQGFERNSPLVQYRTVLYCTIYDKLHFGMLGE